jgi:autotransporter-associated beta strand protein
VHGGFYYDGTNYSQADIGITGYSHIAGFNQGETAGNFLETNGVMYYSTSTNVVNTRSIFLTTNYWQTTLAAYPPHPTTPLLVKYHPPASKAGNSGSGATGGVVVVNGVGGTLYGLGSPVTDTTYLSGASNTVSGGTFVNGGTGTITLGSSNNTVTISGSNSYIGGTSIGGGTLTVGSNSTIGITNGVSGSTNIFSGSTNTNSFGGVTNGGSLGSGSLTVSGSNTLNLGGSNTFTGGLTVTNVVQITNGGTLGSTNSTNDIIITDGEFIDLGGAYFTNPINGLVFSPGITTNSLTISNSGSSDYTLGNFGSSNSLTISPGTSDTISFADYAGTNPDIALTLTEAGATNATGGGLLILPGTNTVEFLLH